MKPLRYAAIALVAILLIGAAVVAAVVMISASID